MFGTRAMIGSSLRLTASGDQSLGWSAGCAPGTIKVLPPIPGEVGSQSRDVDHDTRRISATRVSAGKVAYPARRAAPRAG